MKLGLDELMIVNPGDAPARTSWFLGDDGGLYRLEHPDRGAQGDASLGEAEPVPRFFLSDDGMLYERT
jgi:hypothetical protein